MERLLFREMLSLKAIVQTPDNRFFIDILAARCGKSDFFYFQCCHIP